MGLPGSYLSHPSLFLWRASVGRGAERPLPGTLPMQIPVGRGGEIECHRVITRASYMFRGTGLGGHALSSAHALIPFLPQFPEGAGFPGVSRGGPGPWRVSKGSGEGVEEKSDSQAATVAPTGSRTEQGKSPREEPGGLPGLGRMKA